MPNNLSGQINLVAAIEGASLTVISATNTNIANFSDSHTSDTASNFTASIDWGDGVTTLGTVLGSNGSFTVQADHVYGDENFVSPVVTITRTTDNTQLVLNGGVNVSDSDNLVSQPTPIVPGSANVALNNVTVATFSNNTGIPGFFNNANDFTINIDWGDGNTTAGSATLGVDNHYTVTGSHTYAADGQYTITTFMNDDSPGGDANVGVATNQADIGFGGTVALTAAAETVPVATSTVVANFSDNTGDPVTDYTATINWGDGTTTTGTVTGSAPSFTVTSQTAHTYADEGTPTATVTINRAADGAVPAASITVAGTVTVLENDVFQNAVGTTITGSPGVSTGNVTLATFHDFSAFSGGSPAPASDFVATVDWGDGSLPDTATITGSGGTYTVTDSHIYAQSGQDIITIGIADGGEAQENGQNTAAITAQSTALIGFAPVAGSNFSATEGTAVPAGTQVATFTDSDNTATSTSFTASVNWGDGTSSTGTVSGSGPTFTVTAGPHIYADEGPELVTTTVTHTADSTTITILGNATVAEADVLSVTGDNISGNAGQPLTNVQVATFTDTYTGNVASDFNVAISWGDGTTTPGTVSGSGGTFTVDGSHTYANGGNDTVKVTVGDDAFGTATATGSSTASINLGGTMVLTSATEGTAIANGTPVATFADSAAGDTTSSFTATIAWGDGITTAGTVVGGPGPGTFTVEGGHTYADEGNDTAVVTLTRTSDGSSGVVSGSVAVAEADSLAGTGTTLNLNANNAFSGTVATFTDTDTANVAGDFTATINWDDGTTTAGTVSGSNGSFTVMGSHTYASPGQDFIKVTLADDAPGTATATATTTANIAAISGTMVLASATEGTALPNSTTVATFTDSNHSDTASSFTASINWGDNVTTVGTVVGSNGSFTVEGGHTYADEGSDPASVVLTRTADLLSATASGTVTVAEGDALTGHSAAIMATQGQPFSGTVATFTDTDTANVAGDFAATVSWGDGTTTAGTVSGSNGTFSVSGSHTYATAGFDTVTVTLADDAPGTATATATSTADVGFPGQVVLTAATEGDTLKDKTEVATFTVPGGSASSFTATINWGDGVTTVGDVEGGNGTLTVDGGHTYADEGNDTATVTLTRTSDHLQSTASGTVAVAEDDDLKQHGNVKLALPTVSGEVAEFQDKNKSNVASDFTASIDWGDGTTTTGTVIGSNGKLTVDGTHTYTSNTTETVTVTLTDDAPGTASATATSLVIAQNGNGHHALADGTTSQLATGSTSDLLSQIESFSGASVAPSAGSTMPDGSIVKAIGNFDNGNNSDLVAQTSDGTPEIWMMNGTSVTGTVTLPNPGASWSVIGTGDFSGDGNTDILWQNADGTPGIWEMNGTSVVSMTGLSNPGSSWHAIGTGDFNGDGNADILFQNNDGTPMIWEMNGTTVVAQATLTNPGSQWHAVATGDFFGDGHTDILWQSTDGTPGIWQMNGTSIVSESALTNPGTAWKVIGTGDFTGDGKAGILWQGSDGTIGVWTMDGMTPTAMTAVPNSGATSSANSVQVPSSQPTMHGSAPDMAGAASALANPGVNSLIAQQLTPGSGLHLT